MQTLKIVLLPGLDGTGVLFQPLLQALPSTIQPIVVKYPTDKLLGYDELLPIALKALPKNAPFVILGESFGGPLSLRIAATRPAALKGLVLCATFVSCPYPCVPKWAAHLVRPFPFGTIPKFIALKALLGGYASHDLYALSKQALSLVQSDVLAYRLCEVIRVNVAAELAACDLPMLYIQAQRDWVVPADNHNRILSIKPDVQSVQIASPHMVLQTQPTQAAKAITEFVAKIPTAGDTDPLATCRS